MQKYEYKILEHSMWTNLNETMLNEYGINGWKVVATIENEGYTDKVILMRENQA